MYGKIRRKVATQPSARTDELHEVPKTKHLTNITITNVVFYPERNEINGLHT